MGYGGYPKYVSVAEKRVKAAIALAKLKKKNPNIQPVIIEGRSLAKNWWGKAWNNNLESYADYSNRISRGRSYVKNNAVLDLNIVKGSVIAQVKGSRVKPYEVVVKLDALSQEKWSQVTELCNHSIVSLEQLVEGKFPERLEILFTDHKYGFFPSPEEIHFGCNCPDWAYMCKHVAAVLYGIGSRLDNDPMLFFEIRDVDSHALIKKTMESKLDSMLDNANKKSNREIEEKDIFNIFGV